MPEPKTRSAHSGPAKVQKNLRISPDAGELLRLVSAYEDRSESDLVEEALSIYLQHRALAWRKDLGLPVEAFADGQTAISRTVGRLHEAMEEALIGTKAGGSVPTRAQTSAKERLRERHSRAKATA